MLKQTAVWVSAFAMLGALGACGSSSDDDGPAPAENSPPEISGLSADKDAILAPIGTTLLTVDANDPDGDTLEFAWEVTVGALAPGADDGTAVLTAPPDRGTATVTVTVTDGNGGEATETLDVSVVGWVVPESAVAISADISFNSISFADAENGVAVGGDHELNVPTIYRYTGGTWVDETTGTVGHMTAASAIAPDNMWTAGGGGLAFHFDGVEWSQFTIPGGCTHGMDFLSANDIWATPAEGQPYMRRYTGGMVNAWESYTAPQTTGVNGVSMVSDTDGWAVGNGGTALRFNGTDWQPVDTGVPAALSQVDMITAEDGWIVGAVGTLLHWDGAAWMPVAAPSADALHGVFALATDDVWAVGDNGTIMHWDGVTWTLLPSPVAAVLSTVHFTSPSEGWIAGFDGTILHLE